MIKNFYKERLKKIMIKLKTEQDLEMVELDSINSKILEDIKKNIAVAKESWGDEDYKKSDIGIDNYYFDDNNDDMNMILDVCGKYNLFNGSKSLNDISYDYKTEITDNYMKILVILSNGNFNIIFYVPNSFFNK